MTTKEFLKLLVPPLFQGGLRCQREATAVSPYGLSGDYASWEDARRESSGYEADVILAKTSEALTRVKNGEAAYERDSVLFETIEYSWMTLAGLLWGAARSQGRLHVLDFGGSLGSTYFQHRHLLADLADVQWNVVEQPRHVQKGRECFQTRQLRFYSSVAECLSHGTPTVVLLGSVLPYLECPYGVLDLLSEGPFHSMIIDRTCFWDGDTDRLCVQRVPPHIYDASYPCWVFSRKRFRDVLKAKWNVVAEFQDADRLTAPFRVFFGGMILARHGDDGSRGA